MKTLVKSSSTYEIVMYNTLKKDLLLFDKICYDIDIFNQVMSKAFQRDEHFCKIAQEIAYLRDKGHLTVLSLEDIRSYSKPPFNHNITMSDAKAIIGLITEVEKIDVAIKEKIRVLKNKTIENPEEQDVNMKILANLDMKMGAYKARAYSIIMSKTTNKDYVSIIKPDVQNINLSDGTQKEQVLKFLFSQIPTPDENLPWEAILDYKSDAEVRRRYYALINWANEVANSNMNISEIEDKYNYLLNEYMSQLNLHKLKTQRTSLEVIVNTSAEILENIARFKFSDITKTFFNINKANVDLLEAETKITGRELAYIYDVNKKFK